MPLQAAAARAIVLACSLFPFSSAPKYESIRVALHRIGASTPEPVMEIETMCGRSSVRDLYFDSNGDLILDRRETYDAAGRLTSKYLAAVSGSPQGQALRLTDGQTIRAQLLLFDYAQAR